MRIEIDRIPGHVDEFELAVREIEARQIARAVGDDKQAQLPAMQRRFALGQLDDRRRHAVAEVRIVVEFAIGRRIVGRVAEQNLGVDQVAQRIDENRAEDILESGEFALELDGQRAAAIDADQLLAVRRLGLVAVPLILEVVAMRVAARPAMPVVEPWAELKREIFLLDRGDVARHFFVRLVVVIRVREHFDHRRPIPGLPRIAPARRRADVVVLFFVEAVRLAIDVGHGCSYPDLAGFDLLNDIAPKGALRADGGETHAFRRSATAGIAPSPIIPSH